MAVIVGLQVFVVSLPAAGKQFQWETEKRGFKKIRLCVWSDPYS
jgi:hypothetical protein